MISWGHHWVGDIAVVVWEVPSWQAFIPQSCAAEYHTRNQNFAAAGQAAKDSAWILPVWYFLLFRKALQVLGFLIFMCKSFFRVVIPKAHHRVSRLFKKQNGTVDKQRKPSDLGCPQCQAEPDSHSLCLSYTYICTPPLCSACSVALWAHAPLLPPDSYLQTVVSPSYSPSAGSDSWLHLKLELCTRLVNCILLFSSVHVSHLPRSYWKSKQGDLQHIFTLHSPVQSTEGRSLVFLHVFQKGN